MALRRNRTIDMPAPYLRRIWLDPSGIADRTAYPFCLPFLRDDFELSFDRPITIIVGENGTGKSTFLEGIAVLAGYDEAGGGKGYMPVDHSEAIETMGGRLSKALRAGWLPRITNGWFFRAESFFSVARYQDKVMTEVIPGVPPGIPPDYLSHSHGEGFLRFLRALSETGHLYLRRTGIGAVAGAPDRIPEADAADGGVHDLPGGDGHALAGADGLSRRAAAAAVEIWAGAGDRRTDGSLQDHAGVLRRSGGVCGRGDGGIVPPPLRSPAGRPVRRTIATFAREC
jgi:hypothetical protein